MEQENHTIGLQCPYEALDRKKQEIRFLSFTVDEDSLGLGRCTTTIVSLASKPRFKAVSYVCGNASVARTLILNETALRGLYLYQQEHDNTGR